MKIINTNIKEVKLIQFDEFRNKIEVLNDCKIIWQYDFLRKFIDKNLKYFVCEYEICMKYKYTFRGIYINLKPRDGSILLTCRKGKAFCVIINLRCGTDGYKDKVYVELNGAQEQHLYIPKGFGYGLLSLDDETILHLKTDNYLDDKYRYTINYKDYKLNINLPLQPQYMNCRDKFAPFIEDYERIFDEENEA